MKRPPAGAAAAKRRHERAMAASDGLAEILGDAVGALTARAIRELRARAMSAAGPALVAAGSTLAVDDLPTPRVPAVGAAGTPMPAIQWLGLWDDMLWEAAIADSEAFLFRFIAAELAELEIEVTAEQPFVRRLVASRVDQITAWGDEFRYAIRRTLERGFRDQQSVQQVAKAIEDAGLANERRSVLIARTELISASNEATFHGATAIANPGDRKVWLSGRDPRVRPDHEDADGQEVSLDQPFKVGGHRLMFPGDRSLGAPASQISNCRCSWRVVYAD